MLLPLTRIRRGLPRFAALTAGDAPATIVAFGTSMTAQGRYLEHVLPLLRERTGSGAIGLINRGLRGFCTAFAAYRTGSDVVTADPDLVLVEFAHNDLFPFAVGEIAPALHGMVAQVRAARPDCEFAFVYLAQPGLAAAGPTEAMIAYEAVADYFGFPSIDLATAIEAALARGDTSWEQLTTDGIHYAERAADAIGRPFAAAFADLVASSRGMTSLPPLASIPSPYERTAWRAAGSFISDRRWVLGEPLDHVVRNADAFSTTVAQPLDPTSSLRIDFDGMRVGVWTMGSSVLRVTLVGTPFFANIPVTSGAAWNFTTLTSTMPPGSYSIEITSGDGSVVFGDVYVLGGSFIPS